MDPHSREQALQFDIDHHRPFQTSKNRCQNIQIGNLVNNQIESLNLSHLTSVSNNIHKS